MHAWLADLTPPTAAERLADYYRRAIAAGVWHPHDAHARGALAMRALRRWRGTAAPPDDDELPPWQGERYVDLLHAVHCHQTYLSQETDHE